MENQLHPVEILNDKLSPKLFPVSECQNYKHRNRVYSSICFVIILILLIPMWMMNINLVNFELKNNRKIENECAEWRTAKNCTYFNWTVINNLYVARVDTLVPRIRGTYTCKKVSYIIASSDTCYYANINKFYIHKKCGVISIKYRILAIFSFAWGIVNIIIHIINITYPDDQITTGIAFLYYIIIGIPTIVVYF